MKTKTFTKSLSGLAMSFLLAASLTPAAAFADEPADEGATATKIEEPAADASTTAPNRVNEAVPDDDKKGSDISYQATVSIWGSDIPIADSSATITADDVKSGKTLGDVSQDFQGTDLGDTKCSDLVMKGDMAIQNQDGSSDTTNEAAHEVEKDSKHDIQTVLDVSAVHNSVTKTESLAANSNAAYVNNLETGLRATFTFGPDLSGEFYVPTSLEDAQAHYVLVSADENGNPLIYRINYADSTFTKDKVVIVMDLDLTQMGQMQTTYDGSSKMLYGTDENGQSGIMENFNHTEDEYGDTYDTSTFGNLKQLITSSAKKIGLTLKDVLFHSATGNSTTTETDAATTTTMQGTVNGTLVGYMKANVGHSRMKGAASYVWGTMQEPDGKDVNAAETDDGVSATVQFTETTPKESPVNPGDNPNPSDNPGGTPAAPTADSTPYVQAGQTVSAPAASQASTVPQTGDAESLPVVFLLALAAAGACVTLAACRIRREADRQ